MLKAISTITNALGALNYKGTWNASSNTPTLADGTGAKGDYYVTSTAGTQTFGGLQLFFGIGDWIVYNGAVWQRVEGGSDGNFSNVTMTSTDAGAAAAPLLDLYRDSATPAASDTLGEIEFNGEDSAGNKQQYAVIHGSILSPTSTAETGQIHFETATAGASTEKMIIGSSNLVINDIGAVFNVRIEGDTDANLFFTDATNDRIGVGTITPTVKFEVNGAAKASSLSVTGTSTVAAVNASGTITGSLSTNGLYAGLIVTNGNVGTAAYAEVKVGNGNGNDVSGLRAIGSAYTTSKYDEQDSTVLIAYRQNLNLVAENNKDIQLWAGTSKVAKFAFGGIVTMGAYGAGTATFSAAGVISSVSDETWKTKDGIPTNPDAMLQKLAPGYWYYNDEKKETFGADRQLGFYAQNVNAAIGPEAAPEPEEGKPWGYYDRSVLAVTVMSLQKALSTIELLTARIVALENK